MKNSGFKYRTLLKDEAILYRDLFLNGVSVGLLNRRGASVAVVAASWSRASRLWIEGLSIILSAIVVVARAVARSAASASSLLLHQRLAHIVLLVTRLRSVTTIVVIGVGRTKLRLWMILVILVLVVRLVAALAGLLLSVLARVGEAIASLLRPVHFVIVVFAVMGVVVLVILVVIKRRFEIVAARHVWVGGSASIDDAAALRLLLTRGCSWLLRRWIFVALYVGSRSC